MARRADAGVPQIRERRPRARRRCLRCRRVFVTTIDRRTCRPCTVVNGDLTTGAISEATTVLVAIQATDSL